MLPESKLKFLSCWDQMAFPEYVYAVLCFPLDNNKVRDATAHIEDCLEKLSEERPDLSGDLIPSDTDPRLFTSLEDEPVPEGNHKIVLLEQAGMKTPFDVIHCEDEFGMTYEELRARGFPASAFEHPRFAYERAAEAEGKEKRKPLRLVAVVINGGLLLSVHFHHTLMDGDCMRMVFEYLSALTRKEKPVEMPSQTLVPLPKPGLEFMQRLRAAESIPDRISLCPECKMLPDRPGLRGSLFGSKALPSKQTSKASTVRIFSFPRQQLSILQDLMNLPAASKRPSSLTCLSALTWAHTTKARITTGHSSESGVKDLPGDPAKLVIPVNWKTRAFQALAGNYFGNSCVLAETNVTLAQLLLAADSDDEIAEVVGQVRKSIDAVDEEFVARRSAMMESIPDLSCVGVGVDPRKPHNLSVNTWRYFGADTVWDIPGVGRRKFDAIRRGLGQWKTGNAVILPGATNADSLEIQIALPADAMDFLCQDKRWLRWVDKVIG